ncbi:MAG: glycosyltransferase family 1 protein [Candidatus Hydrogenedentes bacterium]|nr:glycosyltransferase family 1 protein [Candidatus Hydrogenedentota bacterium]
MTTVRAALVVDKEMCEVHHRRHRLVSSLLEEFPGSQLFPATGNYAPIVREVRERQSDFECVIVFAKFMNIYKQDNLFAGLRGPVYMVEHDAWMNYSERNPLYRRWSEYLSKNRIDAIAVSGRSVQERLQEEGFQCWYLPKAAPAAFLEHRNSYSGCVCMFGNTQSLPGMYESRKEMFDSVRRVGLLDRLGFKCGAGFAKMRQTLASPRGIPRIHTLRFEFREMPEMLRLYSAAIICDIGMREPMAKHFEVSGLGVAPIRDDETKGELEKLGYKDGESMVLYNGVDDLVDKLNFYSQNDGQLRSIQDAAREAARANTWEVRARTLRDYIENLLQTDWKGNSVGMERRSCG